MQRLILAILMLLIVAVWGWTFVLVKDAQPQKGDFGREEYLAQFALD